MKIKLVFLFVFVSFLSFAQFMKLDLKTMEKDLKNPKSENNYEKIKFKYLGYPQGLDSLEIQYLYYGRNFVGDNISMTDESFKKLASFYKQKNFDKSIKLGLELFKKDPTSLDVLLILLQSYNATKDERNFVFRLGQLRVLLGAIRLSGDGKTSLTPFLVNTVGDEYIFLNSQNIKLDEYSRSSQQTDDGMMDVWKKDDQSIYVKILYLED